MNASLVKDRNDVAWTIFIIAVLVLTGIAAPDVSYRDAGEIGTASFVLGVPHPTGFPLDMLLLRLGAMLPIGPIAWRQNITVALISAAFLAFIGQITMLVAERCGVSTKKGGNVGAVVTATGVGTWMTFLDTALSVEVYSTALLLIAVAGYASLREARYIGVLFFLVGLAAGAHVTAGLMILPILIAAFVGASSTHRLRLFINRIPLVFIGALIVCYLPLASLRNPPADWGNPETISALFNHLTAQRIRYAFQSEMLGGSDMALLDLFKQLLEQWWLFPLSVLGLGVGLRRARPVFLSLLVLFATDLAYCGWINPMGIRDRQVGHLLGSLIALFAGIGLALLCTYSETNRSFSIPSSDHLRPDLIRGNPRNSAAILAVSPNRIETSPPRIWVSTNRSFLGQALVNAISSHLVWRKIIICLSIGFCGALILRVPRDFFEDRYTPSELLGSGGPISELPSKAVFICSSDDWCAAGMFASFVEVVRPDVVVVPAQHLWDITILNRLSDLPTLRAFLSTPPVVIQARRAFQQSVVRALASGPSVRPLFWESKGCLSDAGYRGQITTSSVPPFIAIPNDDESSSNTQNTVQRFDARRKACLPDGRASSEYAKDVWSISYNRIGRSQLESGQSEQAIIAMRRAIEIAPLRARAWSNLAVALFSTGRVRDADAALQRAIKIDPSDITSWSYLVRFSVARGDFETADNILHLMLQAGISVDKVTELAREFKMGSAFNPAK
jgi:hypothetical protein